MSRHCIVRRVLGCHGSGPPGDPCNRRATRRYCNIYTLLRIKDILRATRMSRERTCPAALTAKGLALLRDCIARHFLGCHGSGPPGGLCNRRAKCRCCKNFGDSPEGAADERWNSGGYSSGFSPRAIAFLRRALCD